MICFTTHRSSYFGKPGLYFGLSYFLLTLADFSVDSVSLCYNVISWVSLFSNKSEQLAPYCEYHYKSNTESEPYVLLCLKFYKLWVTHAVLIYPRLIAITWTLKSNSIYNSLQRADLCHVLCLFHSLHFAIYDIPFHNKYSLVIWPFHIIYCKKIPCLPSDL